MPEPDIARYKYILDEILRLTDDGFIVVDPQGVVTDINEQYCDFLGRTRDEVVGYPITKVIKNSKMIDIVRRRYSEELALHKYVPGDTKANDDNFVLVSRSCVFDDADQVVAGVAQVKFRLQTLDSAKRLMSEYAELEFYREEYQNYSGNQYSFEHIVGSGERFLETKRAGLKAAKTDFAVLLTGETGTGKEVFARAIHNNSPRSDKPMVSINCAAIPSELLESELFGYEDGAFTGARRRGKAGFFELANEGTLFLDEIGELDLDLQVKLLRVIQEGEVTRIGGTKTLHVDVRIIAATNRDLWQQVQEGKFRQDLYYRLNVINIEVPPLRERRDDVIPLAVHFIEKYNQKYSKHKELSMELGKILRSLDWLGNIRELENLIENMVVLVQRDVLYPEDLPPRYRQSGAEVSACQVTVHGIMPLKEAIQQVESQLLCHAQEKYTTTREIAKVLGVDQSTVSRKMGTLLHR